MDIEDWEANDLWSFVDPAFKHINFQFGHSLFSRSRPWRQEGISRTPWKTCQGSNRPMLNRDRERNKEPSARRWSPRLDILTTSEEGRGDVLMLLCVAAFRKSTRKQICLYFVYLVLTETSWTDPLHAAHRCFPKADWGQSVNEPLLTFLAQRKHSWYSWRDCHDRLKFPLGLVGASAALDLDSRCQRGCCCERRTRRSWEKPETGRRRRQRRRKFGQEKKVPPYPTRPVQLHFYPSWAGRLPGRRAATTDWIWRV